METEIFTEKEAAAYLKVSASFLGKARMASYPIESLPGPAWLKLGKRVRYRRQDLDEWLQAHRRGSASE